MSEDQPQHQLRVMWFTPISALDDTVWDADCICGNWTMQVSGGTPEDANAALLAGWNDHVAAAES